VRDVSLLEDLVAEIGPGKFEIHVLPLDPALSFATFRQLRDDSGPILHSMEVNLVRSRIAHREHLLQPLLAPLVQDQRPHLRDVDSQAPMDARALYAQGDSEVDARPLGVFGPAVGTNTVRRKVLHLLEQSIGIVLPFASLSSIWVRRRGGPDIVDAFPLERLGNGCYRRFRI